MKKMGSKLKKVLKIISRKEMIVLPGNIAYSLVLSIFPAIIVLTFIISLFNLKSDDILNILFINMPNETYELISNFLKGDSSSFALITFISGIIFASSGAKSIIVSANMLYKTDEKNVVKMTIKSYILVLVLMFAFMFTVLILGYGSIILNRIVDYLKLSDKTIYNLLNILKWPISFGFIFMFIKIIYVVSPSVKIKSKSVNRGALFTTIFWILATFIYSVYVTNFAKYDVFYGSLSSIVILMIWIYILSYILVLGFIINASNYLESVKKSKI